MHTPHTRRQAVGRGAVAVIVIVLIVLAGAAIYYYTSTAGAPTTTTPTSSSSGSTSTTGSSTITTSTSPPLTTSSVTRDTLVIDDVTWVPQNLNQLWAVGEVPYPDWLTYTVYQPLVTLDANALYKGGVVKILPALASNWTISPDGRTYTFNLRQGITFHPGGHPLNAYQVWAEMYGFYFLSGNSSGWLESYNIFDMSQVKFGPSTISLLTKSGLISPNSAALALMQNNNWPIYVTNPYQIVFHLKAPFNYFLGTLVVFEGLIFDTQYVLDNGGWGGVAGGTGFNTYFDSHPIPGTGPYLVTGVSLNAWVKFQQDPNYWGRNMSAADIQANPYLDPGHVKNVVINAKTDDLARYADLSSGQAQIAGIQSADYRLVLANPSKFGVFLFPDKSAVFVGVALNTQRYPTNITAVRQAIVHAINYTDVSSKVFYGGLTPMVGPEYPVFSQFYDLGNLPPYSYNLTLAKSILSAAHIDPTKLPSLEFRVIVGCDICEHSAEVISNDLSQLGLTVTILVTPSAQYVCPYIAGTCGYSTALSGAQQTAHLAWYGTLTFAPAADTPADNWLLPVNNGTSSNNWAIYSNPIVQACVNAWSSTSNTTVLTDLCTKAQAQIYSDAPYIWLGTIKPFFGGGSVVWDKTVINSFFVDPVFSGQSTTAIFNTVTFNS